MKTTLSALFVSALLLGGALAEDAKTYSVSQVTDASASKLSHMFRFEPDLLQVPAGATVSFDNFDGDHTVVSIKKMTPDGGPSFKFNKLDADRSVTFDTPGIYGVTCGLHGRFGMAMLINVGDGSADIAGGRSVVPGGRKGKKLIELLDKLEAQ
ncbi:plastocyanin/azurin family copper-binding protein [Pseudovibrio sp. Tun.PSC04-5.I4]|uniref:plastocyanin/azurin family copper-binding protein n=1 Tax=Pseudovibrio sp. Tun.PSC04-5.I4 TaxID=1798213 RepID=UPI0008821F28|nr:plastocyanin/azurin family copper-binding protein [Pseudovibrio sp. Tun.PSC04-5.I4]SDR34612.1 Plastocyanin [Pseudovibrio sp. Tun.PSC04-5.I4]